MKAKCLKCKWRGEVSSPEIKTCPLCGKELLHYFIDTGKPGFIFSQKGDDEDATKETTKKEK